MPIDKSLTYETHHPKELTSEGSLAQVKRQLTAEGFEAFEKSRKRADSGGPIMVGTPGDMQPAKMRGADLDRLYTQALKEGANPCYVDEETGQVHLGHFLFVPPQDDD